MNKYLITIIGIIAVIALIIGITGRKSASDDLADRVISTGEIRIGYIVYPPLLYKDAQTGKLSGVSYDIVEAAAKNLGLKTDWVEEVGWGTAIEGLKTNRYDMLGTEMWPNSARAREAVFSIAPMNSVIYPYVKTGDARFNNLSALNSNTFAISVLEGEMAAFIAKQDFPNARVVSLPQLSSTAEVFMNILNGKADIAFVEPSTANDFLKSNPGEIERVDGAPVRTLGNGFIFKRGENSMVAMWNTALRELVNDGTVGRILEKYGVDNDYIINK